MNTINGELLESTSNHYDLMSSLEHEKAHQEDKANVIYGLKHEKVYLEQIKGDYFGKTTKGYKNGLVRSVIDYLVDELTIFNFGGSEKQVVDFLKDFNTQNEETLGYKINLSMKRIDNDTVEYTFKINKQQVTYLYNEKTNKKIKKE